MTKLLFIKATPHDVPNGSIALAEAFLSALKAKTPGLSVDTLDLWKEKIPEFDGDKAAAKYNVMMGQEHQGRQRTAWDEIVAVAGRFIAADHYLFAVPMWNGGIPYKLKHYIDVIHQPGLLFGLDPATGYFGLLKNKRATLCYTSGAYKPGAPAAFGIDHHSTYMRAWLNQAGVTDIKEIRFQPTLLTGDPECEFRRARDMATAAA